ncbi:glycosyltransferase family 2 protein [uncultured Phascolarctobacterium sp.]|uniref:glycosyltransferase family 2 protein n=1 Tax=uncultured Phascolarctobacterium sp. TaxID=512296 RepID=UPI0025ED3C0F|nr:glycosyltransferase family 2 protein [uncultured Phascolarctobacterium sp.]
MSDEDMGTPLISVIIPVYGVEKYIAQCLESVINQTYKNLEIIVINDGTKDRSADIAKEYAAKDSRIKVYDFENRGLSVARNRGLEIATGDYISYIDSDDWIGLKLFEVLIDSALTNNADMVKYGVIETDESKETRFSFDDTKIILNERMQAFDYYFQGMLWTIACNALYRCDLAKKVKFPENIVHEDNYSSGLFLYFAKKVVSIPFCGYYYRVNNTGISKGKVKRPLDKILAISKLRKELLASGFINKKLDWKLSVEFYHFVRGWNDMYRVVAMQKNLYEYIMSNLDTRRKISFWWMGWRRRIVIK